MSVCTLMRNRKKKCGFGLVGKWAESGRSWKRKIIIRLCCRINLLSIKKENRKIRGKRGYVLYFRDFCIVSLFLLFFWLFLMYSENFIYVYTVSIKALFKHAYVCLCYTCRCSCGVMFVCIQHVGGRHRKRLEAMLRKTISFGTKSLLNVKLIH